MRLGSCLYPCLVLACVGAIGAHLVSCAAEPASPYANELSPEEIEIRDKLREEASSKVEWRQTKLPGLLALFGSANPEQWRFARTTLLANPNTPSRRRQPDGTEKKEHILERLIRDDWDSESSRRWLVREGKAYEALALFNSKRREDWTVGRERLCALGDDPDERMKFAQRCAFELVLRLLNIPDSEKYESDTTQAHRLRPGGGRAFGMERPGQANWIEAEQARRQRDPQLSSTDRGLWAMEELELIGLPAVGPIMLGTYLWYQGAGPEGVRLMDSLFMTVSRMGELAVPALLEDLEHSRKFIDDPMWAFQRVRRLVRTLGVIYGPANDGTRPAWQRTPAHKAAVLKVLTAVLREFDPKNDDRQYTIRVYVIEAFAKIGDPSVCPVLVELWRANAEDDYLVGTIIKALRWLTGKNLTRLADWQRHIGG